MCVGGMHDGQFADWDDGGVKSAATIVLYPLLYAPVNQIMLLIY